MNLRPLAMWVLALIITTGIVGEWSEAAALHLGRRETLQIELTNHSVRPVRLQFEPALPAAIQTPQQVQEVVIAPASNLIHNIAVLTIAIGTVPWKSLPVRIAGPAGLAWWPGHLSL